MVQGKGTWPNEPIRVFLRLLYGLGEKLTCFFCWVLVSEYSRTGVIVATFITKLRESSYLEKQEQEREGQKGRKRNNTRHTDLDLMTEFRS